MNVHSVIAPASLDRPDKRDAILDAALELFAERGFHGTAVPLVAERAKVGAGTIYRYFASKEALVNVVYKRWKSGLAHAIMTDFPYGAPAREQFHVFFHRVVAFAREQPLAFKFLELHHHAPYLDEASRALEAQILAPALAFFEECQQRQIMKDMNPRILMAILWGSIVGVIRAAWEGHLTLNDAILEQAERCCWEAIRR